MDWFRQLYLDYRGGRYGLVVAPHDLWTQSLCDRLLGRRRALCRHQRWSPFASVYILSGLVSSVAAIIYVAHLGQAKSDAGTGYELMAITAVVLGGTSIFGGRGTVLGTVLGLFAIVILQNGLRLSAQPAELAGILTGVLLVTTILLDRISKWQRLQSRKTAAVASQQTEIGSTEEEFE